MAAAVAAALAIGTEGAPVLAVDEYETGVVPEPVFVQRESELVPVAVYVRMEAVPDRLGIDHGANRSLL